MLLKLSIFYFVVYDFGRTYGESCYRLRTRTGQFIYLKTRGCLEVDDRTRQVHSFVSVNSLVPDEEGRRLIREMKKKFSAIISEAELSAMESDVPTVENPQNLERAILNLITNLNNTTSYDDDNVSMISDSTVEAEDNRRIKSPPLAIIAPKHNTIKQSIFNAVSVMGHATKGKSPSVKDEPGSPDPSNQMSPQTLSKIKVEPTNVLSPSSSISSADSDMSSPFLSSDHHRHMKPISDNTNEIVYISSRQSTPNNNSNKSDDYPLPFDSLTGYSSTVTTDTTLTPSNSLTVNNNNSSVNRNSVLKRTYIGEDDDYSIVVKKRTFSAHSPAQTTPNPSLDLMNTSGSGIVIKSLIKHLIYNVLQCIQQIYRIYYRRSLKTALQINFNMNLHKYQSDKTKI